MKFLQQLLTWRNLALAIFFILFDFAVYAVLGFCLMGYEDHWDGSKGPFWSWESMTGTEQAFYTAFIGWQVLNVLVLAYCAFYVIKGILRKPIPSSSTHF